MIIPKLLNPGELSEIRERVHGLIMFWTKYYAFEKLSDMPQYVQDTAALLGHIEAVEIDKEQPPAAEEPPIELPFDGRP